MDAQQPGAERGDAPHEEDAHRDGRPHVPRRIERHDHIHIDGAADLQEDFHKEDRLPQRVYLRIVRENGKDRVAVEKQKDGDAPGNQDRDENGELHPPVHLVIVPGALEIAHEDLRGHRQRLGIHVARHGDDIGVDLRGDDRNAEHIDEFHDHRLRALVGEGLPAAGNADGQNLPERVERERPQIRKRQPRRRIAVKQPHDQHQSEDLRQIGGNADPGHAQ